MIPLNSAQQKDGSCKSSCAFTSFLFCSASPGSEVKKQQQKRPRKHGGLSGTSSDESQSEESDRDCDSDDSFKSVSSADEDDDFNPFREESDDDDGEDTRGAWM